MACESEQLLNTTAILKSEERWYPIYVRHQKERKVLEILEHRGYTMYLPLIRTKKKWSDRMKWVEKPLFRGYVFVHMEKRFKYPVLETPGVITFIHFKDEIASIPDEQIDIIKMMLSKPETFTKRKKKNIEGKMCKVVSGPFSGMKGKVVRLKNRTRIFVDIDHFNQIVSVEVDENDIVILAEK